MDAEFVNEVRLEVLESTLRTAHVPDAQEVGDRLGRPTSDIVSAFAALAETHVYVLEPGDPSRLRMANPFSAVPTRFTVESVGRRYFGNCIWDALGIVSLQGGEGVVLTDCPDCKEPMTMEVNAGRLQPAAGVVHFAVPARRWWDDIIHT